jgi:hypothetical protein
MKEIGPFRELNPMTYFIKVVPRQFQIHEIIEEFLMQRARNNIIKVFIYTFLKLYKSYTFKLYILCLTLQKQCL